VLEFASLGTLYDHLNKTRRIPILRRLHFALDIVQGMAFLHSLTPPLIHRGILPYISRYALFNVFLKIRFEVTKCVVIRGRGKDRSQDRGLWPIIADSFGRIEK